MSDATFLQDETAEVLRALQSDSVGHIEAL